VEDLARFTVRGTLPWNGRSLSSSCCRERASTSTVPPYCGRPGRLLARVSHPNIVSVYGVDRHEGRVGFWSDYIAGGHRTLNFAAANNTNFADRYAAVELRH